MLVAVVPASPTHSLNMLLLSLLLSCNPGLNAGLRRAVAGMPTSRNSSIDRTDWLAQEALRCDSTPGILPMTRAGQPLKHAGRVTLRSHTPCGSSDSPARVRGIIPGVVLHRSSPQASLCACECDMRRGTVEIDTAVCTRQCLSDREASILTRAAHACWQQASARPHAPANSRPHLWNCTESQRTCVHYYSKVGFRKNPGRLEVLGLTI